VRIVQARTTDLGPAEIADIRALLWAAFDSDDEDDRFTEEDWQHALGGVHFLADVDGRIVAHAAVVQRALHFPGRDRPIRTGYVEAVATAPGEQRRGFGTAVMRAVNAHISSAYELGALGTGSHGFYERLGWRTWRGPTAVRTDDGEVPTPDEDGYILVLMTPTTPNINLDDPISCEWRPGDVW
jgi:aminoglycoside 2'-N-acetyltransferase I